MTSGSGWNFRTSKPLFRASPSISLSRPGISRSFGSSLSACLSFAASTSSRASKAARFDARARTASRFDVKSAFWASPESIASYVGEISENQIATRMKRYPSPATNHRCERGSFWNWSRNWFTRHLPVLPGRPRARLEPLRRRVPL